MKLISLLLLLSCVVGCKGHCLPCDSKIDNSPGYYYYFDGSQTHCIPCSKAKTQDARFVCFGE